MFNSKKYILPLGIILALASSLSASNDAVSTTGSMFLTTLIQPRPAALAGAFTAVSDDLNSIYFNPAGLARMQDASIAVSYRTGVEDMGYVSAALNYPIGKEGSFGAAFSLMRQGEMDIFHPDGLIEKKSLSSSYWFGLSYAFSLPKEILSFGATAKLVNENLVDYSASGIAFDLGIKCNPGLFKDEGRKLVAGVVLQNIGAGLRYVNESEPLPLLLKTGLSFYQPFVFQSNPMRLLLACDAAWEKGYDAPSLQAGMEFGFRNAVFVRAGYSRQFNSIASDRSGFSTGLGIRAGMFRFDYAVRLTGNLLSSYAHSLGVSSTFEGGK